MRKQLINLGTAAMLILSVACNSNSHQTSESALPLTRTTSDSASTDSFSLFIPVDTANKMLGSYLTSVHYQQNDTDLQSLIIDVRQLRRYIDSLPASNNISHLKLMFAHTLKYTNSPKVNTNAGYKSYALTLIIAAYNDSGNYVFYTDNKVLEYAQPCPPVCPPGNAGSPFLIN